MRRDAPTRLLRVAERLCGAEARDRVFEPLLADWQHEWGEARTPFSRVRVTTAGGAAYLWSVARCLTLESSLRVPSPIGIATLVTFFVLAAVVLQLQPLHYVWRHWAWDDPVWLWAPPASRRLLLVLPRNLRLGVMMAMVPAGLVVGWLGWRGRRLVAVAATGGLLVLVLDGWVPPSAHARGTPASFRNAANHSRIPPSTRRPSGWSPCRSTVARASHGRLAARSVRRVP